MDPGALSKGPTYSLTKGSKHFDDYATTSEIATLTLQDYRRIPPATERT
jgi:hypothetical protein